MDYRLIGFSTIILINFLPKLYKMVSYKIKMKLRCDKELLRINSNNYNVPICLIYIVILVIIVVPSVYILTPKFIFLGDYFDNPLQWINLSEIEKLQEYFFEQNLAAHLFTIIEYKNLLLNFIFISILMPGLAIFTYIEGRRDIFFYEDGVLILEELSKWDDLIKYSWSDPYKTKLKRKTFFKLLLTFKDTRYNSEYNLKIRVKYEDKESVNNILAAYYKEIYDELELRFLPFPVIPTKRLILRKLTPKNKTEIFKIKSNDEVLKYMDNKKHESIEESEEYIKKINDGISNNEWIQWGITLKDMDTVIGTICLWNISNDNKTAEVGYELMPEHQGTGIMNEALSAVIKYAFNIVKFKSLIAYTHSENLKSLNLLERNKFILDSEEGNYKIYKLCVQRI